MKNSKHFFRLALSKLLIILISWLGTSAIGSLFMLPVLLISGNEVYYVVVAILTLFILVLHLSLDDIISPVKQNLCIAKEMRAKENLMRKTINSSEYKSYVAQKTTYSDILMLQLRDAVDDIDLIEELSNKHKLVSQLIEESTYLEKSVDLLAQIIISPSLLDGEMIQIKYTRWFNYIAESRKLLYKYSDARYPSSSSQSDMSPSEIESKIKGLTFELNLNVKEISISEINEFMVELNYISSLKK